VNVSDAAHKTVHDYPGGSESLGPRMSISPAVLRSKVNPNTATHRLALDEADEMMGITGDHRILHALAANHGYTLQRIEAAPTTMMGAHLAATVAKGTLAAVLVDALGDGLITPLEAKAIAGAGSDLQSAVINLVSQAYKSSKVPHG
jgi:hypothetical protein